MAKLFYYNVNDFSTKFAHWYCDEVCTLMLVLSDGGSGVSHSLGRKFLWDGEVLLIVCSE